MPTETLLRLLFQYIFGINIIKLGGHGWRRPYAGFVQKWFILGLRVQQGGNYPFTIPATTRTLVQLPRFISFNPGPCSCPPGMQLPSPFGSSVNSVPAGYSLHMGLPARGPLMFDLFALGFI